MCIRDSPVSPCAGAHRSRDRRSRAITGCHPDSQREAHRLLAQPRLCRRRRHRRCGREHQCHHRGRRHGWIRFSLRFQPARVCRLQTGWSHHRVAILQRGELGGFRTRGRIHKHPHTGRDVRRLRHSAFRAALLRERVRRAALPDHTCQRLFRNEHRVRIRAVHHALDPAVELGLREVNLSLVPATNEVTRMRNRLFAVAVALLVLPATVLAATWTVKPDGTGDSPSIQAAIVAASNGDVILLTDGTFTGAANRNFSYDKKAITIESVNGPTATIIDCGGLQGARFLRRETETSVLRGVTIVNASIGIECRPGSPLIENCVITGPVSWGVMAGVENNEILLPSSPRFENCTISNCSFGMVTLLGGDIRFNTSVATGCGSAYSAGRGFFTAKNSQFISNSSGVLFGLSASFLAGGSLTG